MPLCRPTHDRASLPRRFAALALPAALVMGVTLGAGAPAQAQEGRQIAAISLLGNKMTVVTQQSRTGTRINQNVVDVLDLPAGVVDLAALNALVDGAKVADPSATILALNLPSATFYGDPDKLFKDTQFLTPAKLDPTLKQIKASHLLVVTAHRAPANIRGWRDGIGSGQLEGVGFYIDRELRIQNLDSGQQQVGYLAPYVYVKVRLVNLATSTVEREKVVAQAVMMSSDRKEAAPDPWQAMTDRDKLVELTEMLKRSIVDTLPALLQNR